MLVELRRIFRKAGIERFHVEAWSHAETAFGQGARPPFPDVAELFGPVGKLWILRRAWRRWEWRRVWSAISRIGEVRGLMVRERILSPDVATGVRRSASPSRALGGAGGADGDVQTVTAGAAR